MTVSEMHIAVQLGLDKTSSLTLAAFTPWEIDYWLNEAQLELIKRKAFGNNYRQEGLQDSVKRMDDLSPLIKSTTFASGNLTTNANYSNVKSVAIPSTYMFFVDASVKLTSGLASQAQLVRIDQIKNLVKTPYNIPFIRTPYIYLTEGKLNYIIDPFASITSADITYLKYPLKLVRSNPVTNVSTTTSELPAQVHSELVALTVLMLLENIEAERLQTNQIMYNNKE